MAMKRLTYHNLMAVIKKIECKGYSFDESERLARNIFTDFEASPQGLSIEKRIQIILPKQEWLAQNPQC